MLHTVLADNVGLGQQLWSGIISWSFLQFVVAFVTIFGFTLTSATILVLAERKVMGWMQDRLGPMHTGPWGLLQTVADVAKLLLKEDIQVSSADKAVFWLAPSVFMAPVIAAFAVLPFSPYIQLPGGALATGIIFLVAMSSLDVIGVIMAGWGSNNKYALIGGLRSAAQMISYELPLVLALIGVVMLTSILTNDGIGTISLFGIMEHQNSWQHTGNAVLDFLFDGFTPWSWFILVQPLMLVVYYTCGLAETNRAPFDLPEAESELVAGYLTEYSGMRWAMFFLGEYGNMTIVSAITSYLFLGGFSGPGVNFLTAQNSLLWGFVGNILALGYFLFKIYALCFVFIWVRSTLPRLRSDQLMQFAWLILMPVGLANIVATGFIFLVTDALHLPIWLFLVILGIVNWVALFGFIQLVGRVTVASTRKAQAPAIRAQLRPRAAAPAQALQLRDGIPAPVAQLPQGVASGHK
ncbi:NADH-quinone oxidoreductase subunit NuoH [Tengunoibacter tsumagoiensis]|uniref:NADH-quinone oxidoreductase subunit H n=1 Tax=Tengunoibacter tsumagoiensis TaxID=2014871 RepID=A0A402A4Y2_9CHLR|nr:NADH-quinone oxidoreductase subunit NuoH [Tengunoibacter tsumagoiensis]GCE14061.1 NADH-quinone oxidoreductase subunit H [Tengunoibacter tsumagoiensis]